MRGSWHSWSVLRWCLAAVPPASKRGGSATEGSRRAKAHSGDVGAAQGGEAFRGPGRPAAGGLLRRRGAHYRAQRVMTTPLLALVLLPTPPFLSKERFLADLRALAPAKREVGMLAGGLLVAAALTQVDVGPSRAFRRNTGESWRLAEPLGRYQVGNALGALCLGWGVARHEGAVASAGVAFFEANLLSSLLVDRLQRLAGRQRPGEAHEGRFRHGGTAFPSAHAAHAFAWAGVAYASMPSARGRWVFPALATGVALSRVAEGKHFFGDVAFSSLLGWWLGTRLGHSSQTFGHWQLVANGQFLGLRRVWP